MATTVFLTADQRSQLIDDYIDCWHDTCSYSSEDAAVEEEAWTRSRLEAMSNSELYKEIESTGWGIIHR